MKTHIKTNKKYWKNVKLPEVGKSEFIPPNEKVMKLLARLPTEPFYRLFE